MFDLAYRNIKRQKTRSFLTVLGIIIGIAAIVALGSISEGMNEMMQRSFELSAGKIMIQGKDSGGFTGGFQGSKVSSDDIDAIKDVPGVKEVVPLLFYTGTSGPMGMPSRFGMGMEPTKTKYFTGENINLEEGRDMEDGESEVAVIGKTITEGGNYQVGDSVSIKETEFEIVGILEKSDIAQIDSAIIVPIEDLRDILEVDDYQLAFAVPEDVEDAESVAENVADVSEDIEVMSQKDIMRTSSQMIGQIRMFTLGIGGIAAIVGGLGVMNTMIMAVLERRREIGVLKAIGATRKRVLMQFLTEALLISFIGGLVGILLGAGASLGMMGFSGGFIKPMVTPALAFGALGFALLLGLVGGIYPSWKAAKQDPVEALREL